MRSILSPNIVVDSFGDGGQSYLLQALIRKRVQKIISSGGFLEEDEKAALLPFVDIEISTGESQMGAAFLVCKSSPGVDRFFFEMLSRWLIPGRRLSFDFSLQSTFSFAEEPLETFSFCEARFSCSDGLDSEGLFSSFFQLASEIKLGASSSYQAHKILEHRGLFSSEKNSLIQEKIASLVRQKPEVFDYDLFGQMQHFFLSSGEDFKQIREHGNLSRIIYIFYLFRKALKKIAERIPDKRHVSFKVGRVRLHNPFGLHRVLGIFVGFNFLQKHEVFEKDHLIKAIQEHLPEAEFIEGSLFIYLHKEGRIQTLYLEMQKKGGEEFSAKEIQRLRENFPPALENQIERLMPTLFMPRNEEEVMKNIVRLSQELKYLKDLPQVFISFEEQTDSELTFTVVLVRILLEKGLSIKQLFEKHDLGENFIEDRVRSTGLLRSKYPKEATVFRLKLPKSDYLRGDHSVDLLKARQAVSDAIYEAVGEFRDYNGGMLAKQSENLQKFKELLLGSKKDVDAESFFHSILPIEMRAVVSASLLKQLYLLWQEMVTQEKASPFEFSFQIEQEGIAFMACFVDEKIKEALAEGVKSLQLRSSQCVRFVSKRDGHFYLGYLLLGSVIDPGRILMDHMQAIQDRFLLGVNQ